MRDKQGFRAWLDTNSTLTDSSKIKYLNALDTLSRKYEISIYGSRNAQDVNTLMSDPTFKSYNNSQHHMFSASLNHFKSYLHYCDDVNDFKDEIIKAKKEYEEEQIKVRPRKITKQDIKNKPEPRPNSYIVKGRKVWKRNPMYAAEAILLADYSCEIETSHRHFISKTTNQNYVEAHHLIPISFQDKHEHSIDILANIVSICVACHKQIHHGLFEDKKEILETLFNSRRERLNAAGISIDLDDIYSYYHN